MEETKLKDADYMTEDKVLVKDELVNDDSDIGESVKDNFSNGSRYLMFELGDEQYGVNIEYVIEIIGIQDITNLPGTPKYVKGLINLRGKIIPLIDARKKFGKEEKEYNDRTCVIVLEMENIMVGLVVDIISDVMFIRENQMESAPEIGRIKTNKYISKIAKINQEVKLLLDCKKLINE